MDGQRRDNRETHAEKKENRKGETQEHASVYQAEAGKGGVKKFSANRR